MRVLIVSLVIACHGGSPSSPQSAQPGVFAIACEAECSDELAQLTVYHDAQDQLGVVSVQGSPGGCSHPPLRYFGPDGKQRAVIAFEPVAPGSEEQKHNGEIVMAQTKDLHATQKLLCRDVKH